MCTLKAIGDTGMGYDPITFPLTNRFCSHPSLQVVRAGVRFKQVRIIKTIRFDHIFIYVKWQVKYLRTQKRKSTILNI